MKIKVICKSGHQLPGYSSLVAAGMDRGDVCVLLMNLSSENFVIRDGERIWQMVTAKNEMVRDSAKAFPGSDRRSVGFGHTGKS
jgi:dUTPase